MSTSCLKLLISKWKLKRRLVYECRCDERLKGRAEGSTLGYSGYAVDCFLLCIDKTKVEFILFDYESRKWEVKTRLIYEDRSLWWKTQKLNLRNLHVSHTLGCDIPTVIHTQRRQFHRGRQCLSGSVERTDTPVYKRERGGGRRGNCVIRNTISTVIHTWIRQFRRGLSCLPCWVTRTDGPVYVCEWGGGRRGSDVRRNVISPVIHT